LETNSNLSINSEGNILADKKPIIGSSICNLINAYVLEDVNILYLPGHQEFLQAINSAGLPSIEAIASESKELEGKGGDCEWLTFESRFRFK
jgi:hypothetical protein